MTTIVLVRHATTPATGKRLGGWTPGVHLDDAGHQQAEVVADHLGAWPITAVYASPLERTQETAKVIAQRHGLRVRTRRDIGEVDYGDWTDLPLGQLRRRKLWPVIQTTPSRVTFPNGESIRAMQARAVDAIEELAAAHAGQAIVAVSHADVIKAIVASLVGMPLDTFQRLVVSPASATAVHLPEGAAPVLLACNATGPIPAPPEPKATRTKREPKPQSPPKGRRRS